MNRFNIPWQIGFYREMDLFVVHLICCQPRTDKIWTVATKGTIKTILTNGAFSFTPFQFTAANDSQYGGTAHSSHISHLIDDTFIIELDVTIDSMAGIEKPEKIRSFGVEAEELSDVVLKIDEEKFHVSKMYLAAQSTYFKSLLMGKFEEGKKRVVELKDINPDNFQVFLESLYVDKTLTDSNIEDVLKLVELYDAKNAARLCE
ncbi:hypothetical protein CAEBREN_20589 [Caenorhabditis brenneri]|uniref:BTB domain-containing protein n=1 Tax=Caenorhabditis brenneri TaxID=135651 RepID=G0MWH5_CAEBE|nr:hypothetical protein CAEBREN_20589 [Caenorhabditis brenneri]